MSMNGLRYLSRDEIARFGIDAANSTRAAGWRTRGGGPAGGGEVRRPRRKASPKQYRTMKFELSCGRSGDLRVTFSRELAASDRSASIAVTARTGDSSCRRAAASRILGYNDVEMEDRRRARPDRFFEEPRRAATIEITEAPDLAARDKPSRIKLATAGLKTAIEALAGRCR